MRARTLLRRTADRTGQVWILMAISVTTLVLVLALVIDAGIVYTKRAALVKAVDAAALAGIRNYGQGVPQAQQLALGVFTANYKQNGLDAQAPSATATFSLDNGNPVLDVAGKSFVKPVFSLVLGLNQIELNSRAQAKRAKLVLALALDRSKSMQDNGGCQQLPPAAKTFIDYFDDSFDLASLTTYASHSRVDVPVQQPFKTLIKNAIPTICATQYLGYTFIEGGLKDAHAQNQLGAGGSGSNFVKIIVLFTDGRANTFQDTFNCPPSVLRNLSGTDFGDQALLINPQNGQDLCYWGPGQPNLPCCPGLTHFTPILGGPPQAAYGTGCGARLRQEAKDRALQVTRSARAAGNVIHVIGLGQEGIDLDGDFLAQLANVDGVDDPPWPEAPQPQGLYIDVPDASWLRAAFKEIAKQIIASR